MTIRKKNTNIKNISFIITITVVVTLMVLEGCAHRGEIHSNSDISDKRLANIDNTMVHNMLDIEETISDSCLQRSSGKRREVHRNVGISFLEETPWLDRVQEKSIDADSVSVLAYWLTAYKREFGTSNSLPAWFEEYSDEDKANFLEHAIRRPAHISVNEYSGAWDRWWLYTCPYLSREKETSIKIRLKEIINANTEMTELEIAKAEFDLQFGISIPNCEQCTDEELLTILKFFIQMNPAIIPASICAEWARSLHKKNVKQKMTASEMMIADYEIFLMKKITCQQCTDGELLMIWRYILDNMSLVGSRHIPSNVNEILLRSAKEYDKIVRNSFYSESWVTDSLLLAQKRKWWNCGEISGTVTATFKEVADGTLTIFGKGAMINFSGKFYDVLGASGVRPDIVPWSDVISNVVIEDGVTTIGDLAFADCGKLISITIPKSIISIGKAAFHGCTNLTSITIPSYVMSIKEQAFEACTRLMSIMVAMDNASYSSESGVLFNKNKTTLILYPHGKQVASYTIPSSVMSIEKKAFFHNAGLTSVTIPSNTTSIGEHTFDGCIGLTSITVKNPIPPKMGYATFQGVNKTRACLYVPKNNIKNYRMASGWKEFKCIKAINNEKEKVMHNADFVDSDTLPKHDVVVRDGYRHLDGEYAWYSGYPQWIFSVPESNAVGGLGEYCNGIMLIKFGDNKKETEIKIIAENFNEHVYGNFIYNFSSNFSDDMVIYSKTWVPVFANIKTGEAFQAEFNVPLNDFILGISFLDTQNNLFVIDKAVKVGYNDPWVENLHIAKLEGKELIDLGEVMPRFKLNPAPWRHSRGNNWIVHNRTLFVYGNDNRLSVKRMFCFDSLKETTHPFAETFNSKIYITGSAYDIINFTIHPTLPFGLIVANHKETGHSLIQIRWDAEAPDERFISVSSQLLSRSHLLNINGNKLDITYLSFSPDGKWLAAAHTGDGEKPNFIAIPVDEEHHEFLVWNESVILGNPDREFTSFAWSTAPTALVASDGDALYKWDLGELPNARVIVVPEDDNVIMQKKPSIFRKIARFFRLGR
jgi:hypothetical protein